ncbi:MULTISPECIES: STAS domain-containing protein [Catenuloplanes]|uniref:Anti-anti-sigma factor n=1 Tax=Catenuloplanes niger TaxID=587534 RepID=A0AAE3ZYY2_9ACTN|nr:STAS domain-containing protein [Catenuloplanes niger]MDR7327527.1 anti-anti-sigma factor [Catenuloplanes niger]
MTLVIDTHRLPEPDVVIAIEPQGEIGSSDAARLLRERFTMVLAATRPAHIVVDLSAVPSISDSGLLALRTGCEHAAANDTTVAVIAAAPAIRDRLSRHGLDRLLDQPDSR